MSALMLTVLNREFSYPQVQSPFRTASTHYDKEANRASVPDVDQAATST